MLQVETIKPEVIITTIIIAALLSEVFTKGIVDSFETNLYFFSIEALTVIFTLAVTGPLEKSYVKKKTKLILSSILLLFIVIILGLSLLPFIKINSAWILVVLFLAFQKILSSHRDFRRFRLVMWKGATAVTYSLLFGMMIAMISVFIPNFNFPLELAIFSMALIYLCYVGYFLPPRYDHLKLSRIGPLDSAD